MPRQRHAVLPKRFRHLEPRFPAVFLAPVAGRLVSAAENTTFRLKLCITEL